MNRTRKVATVTAAFVIASLCAGLWSAAGDDQVSSVPSSNAAAEATNVRMSAAAVPLSGKVTPSSAGVFVGVFKPPAPYSILSALDAYAAQASTKQPAIVMWYQPWSDRLDNNGFLPSSVNAAYSRGAVPLITWEPWDTGGDPHFLKEPQRQPAYQLKDIINGRYDSYIRSWARAAKAVGGPVMLRPLHEMNGNWYPWCGTVNGNSPAEFKTAWRRIHSIFKAEGATNVTWVWSINCLSCPDTYANRYAAYYPGDAYVDWTSISGFNWGNTRSTSSWQSFEQIYTKPLAYLTSVGKPIVISEMASVSAGGRKPAWIKHAYAAMRRHYPLVKAVVYYDRPETGLNGDQDWQIASSRASTRAYRRGVGHKRYLAGPMSTLSSWQSRVSPLNASSAAPASLWGE